jgi:hypothetical protein
MVLAKKFNAGQYKEAGKILWHLHYPEFGAASSVPVSIFYLKYFVPWRHKM